ncbi:hypothetical protein DXG01_004417 [Tephrocybe rancida]|nr:hypothetical protein DXG01_004417 [Tephrocybe rancida]
MYNIQPWYAFILRGPPKGKTLQEYLEHNFLEIAWVSDPPPALSTGRIHAKHLFELFDRNNSLDEWITKLQLLAWRKSAWWSQRPTDPSSELIKNLRGKVVEFEDTMQSMEMANDEFMGLWINTTPPDIAFWMIRQRIPIFIIHKVSELEKHLCNSARRVNSFVANSEAERLSVSRNYLEHHAAKWNKWLPPLPTDKWILDADYLRWDMLNLNHFRFSLSQMYSLPGMMVCSAFSAEEMMVSDTHLIRDDQSKGDDRTVLPEDPKHLPRPLDLEEIDPDHVPWIRPPKIVHPPGVKWSKFTKSMDDDRNDCMRKVNSEEELGKYVWYDRERRRKLGFNSDPVVLPGITTDIKIFGMPAPNIHYEHQAHDHYIAEGRSQWMYQTCTPMRQDLLAQVKQPTKSSLPLHSGDKIKPKSIPFFHPSDSDDKEEGFLSDHEDDLFPLFRERAQIAATKEELELLKSNVIPPSTTAKRKCKEDQTQREQTGPAPSQEGHTSMPELTSGEDTTRQEEAESTSSPIAAIAQIEHEPGSKTIASLDDMDVDPNDDVLDYGVSDDKMLPTAPSVDKGKQHEEPDQIMSEQRNEVIPLESQEKDIPSLSPSSHLDEGGTSNHDEDMLSEEVAVEQVSGLVRR